MASKMSEKLNFKSVFDALGAKTYVINAEPFFW